MELHIQSTIFGQLMRFLSRGKLFQYPDEIDVSLWKKAVQQATPEHTNDNSPVDESDKEAQNGTSQGQTTEDHDAGQHVLLVGWYGADDPEVRIFCYYSPRPPLDATLTNPAFHSKNPQNWPSILKGLIVFQMCILNFSVYIASSIYVPGEPGLMEEFGVSEIVAVLGLSLFTL
ncbi:hypothetical protein DL765_009597 [Monosporascus sp. GIB2]|nr:hypothetical protein DL765_009597 [Monosporascus sp. GIB2]